MARRDVPYPYEANLSVTTGDQQLEIAPLNDPALLGVEYRFLSHDEGKMAGVTIQDVQFKVLPDQQLDAVGGDVWQTPYAAVVAGQAVPGRNVLPLGFIARPGETVRIRYTGATAGSVRLRIDRVRLYEARHVDRVR